MSDTTRIEEFIKTHTQSETGKKLYDLLISIEDDQEFAALELVRLKNDERKQKLIDYIERYNIIDPSDVTLLTEDIMDGMEPKFEEK